MMNRKDQVPFTLYSEIDISSLYCSDFVPSRQTRISSNPFLQERIVGCCGGTTANSAKNLHPADSAAAVTLVHPPKNPARRGAYIEVEFADSKQPPRPLSEAVVSKTVVELKEKEQPQPYVNSRSNTDPSAIRRAALRRQRTSEDEGFPYRSRASAISGDMDRPVSFALAIAENPIHFDDLPATSFRITDHVSTSPAASGKRVVPVQTNHFLLHTRTSSPSPPSPLASRKQDVPRMPTETHPSRQQSIRRCNSLEKIQSRTVPCNAVKTSPSSARRASSGKRRSSDPTTQKSIRIYTPHSAGEEIGQYLVTYLGNRDIDQYLGCVDECAKRIIDPKSSFRSADVIVQVCTEKIRLFPPGVGPLFKSIAVSDIVSFSHCSKNKRLIGLVAWKRKGIPTCHLLRCSDHVTSHTVLESIEYAVQNCQECKIDDSYQPPSLSSTLSLPCLYIGSSKAGKNQSVSDFIHRSLLEFKPSQALNVLVKLCLSHITITDTADKEIFTDQTTSLQALGVYQNDERYIGYIAGDSSKSLIGHVLWCGSHQEVITMVTCLQQISQISYENQEESDLEMPSQPGLLSRLLPLSKGPRSPPLSQNPSFQSYIIGSAQNHSSLLDVPSKCKDVVTVPTVVPSVKDISEENFAKFSVMYVGTANLPSPFTRMSIMDALDAFEDKGVAAGMVPPTETNNSIEMYISSLGINLSDTKQKLFVNRNYPRKQIVGYSCHPLDRRYFTFATPRPGFNDQLKVHLFMETTDQLVKQIVESIQFWLNLNPLS